MDRDELFEAVYSGELTAEQVHDLREALQRRIALMRAARERGEPIDADWADLEQLARQLAVLREEELIAEFIERGLTASLNRAEILRQLAERESEE